MSVLALDAFAALSVGVTALAGLLGSRFILKDDEQLLQIELAAKPALWTADMGSAVMLR